MFRLLHGIGDFSLFMRNLLTTQKLWSLEQKKKPVSYIKAWTRMFFVYKNEKRDTMQWASIEAEISSKVKEKETAPIGSQSVHGREVGKFNKRKDHKSESNAQTFHSCKVIHRIAFAYYIKHMFCLKQEHQSPKREENDWNHPKSLKNLRFQ